jgi:hypothetical protein
MVSFSTGSYSFTEPYGTILPTNLDVFSGIAEKIAALENADVAEQVSRVTQHLYLSLKKAYKLRRPGNYLSRMNLVQQDDKAALLEWSFQDFRIGFTLEPERADSSFFVVSQDRSVDAFSAETQKLDKDISTSVDRIVEYVLENT